MYCSGCGAQIQSGLNYCSRCGQRVTPDAEKASVAENLSSTLGYVGSSGFIAFIFVLLVLVKNGIPGNQIIGVTMAYFAALFGICFLILRQTELLAKKTEPQRTAEPLLPTAEEYTAPTTSRLKELAEPVTVASVTEQTTDILEKVGAGRARQ